MSATDTVINHGYAIVGVIGMFGNSLVCLVIWRDSALHTLTNAFIFNQATVDFLGSLFMFIRATIPLPQPVPPGAAAAFLCRVLMGEYFLWSCYIASSFNLVALTFERYLAIVYPYRFQTICQRRGATAVIVSVWVAGFAIGSYGTTLTRYHEGRCDFHFDEQPQVFGVLIPNLLYFILVTSMLFAYIHISIELQRSARRIHNLGAIPVSGSVNQAYESPDESTLRARRNTFKTLVVVFTAYVLCWSPNICILLAGNFGAPVFSELESLTNFSVVMVAVNSAVNPWIYAFKYKRFQEGFKKVFFRRGRVVQPAIIVMT